MTVEELREETGWDWSYNKETEAYEVRTDDYLLELPLKGNKWEWRITPIDLGFQISGSTPRCWNANVIRDIRTFMNNTVHELPDIMEEPPTEVPEDHKEKLEKSSGLDWVVNDDTGATTYRAVNNKRGCITVKRGSTGRWECKLVCGRCRFSSTGDTPAEAYSHMAHDLFYVWPESLKRVARDE